MAKYSGQKVKVSLNITFIFKVEINNTLGLETELNINYLG